MFNNYSLADAGNYAGIKVGSLETSLAPALGGGLECDRGAVTQSTPIESPQPYHHLTQLSQCSVPGSNPSGASFSPGPPSGRGSDHPPFAPPPPTPWCLFKRDSQALSSNSRKRPDPTPDPLKQDWSVVMNSFDTSSRWALGRGPHSLPLCLDPGWLHLLQHWGFPHSPSSQLTPSLQPVLSGFPEQWDTGPPSPRPGLTSFPTPFLCTLAPLSPASGPRPKPVPSRSNQCLFFSFKTNFYTNVASSRKLSRVLRLGLVCLFCVLWFSLSSSQTVCNNTFGQ